MGQVVNFFSRKVADLDYDNATVREPTCDEIAEEYSIAEEEIDLKVDEHLHKSRIKNDVEDLLNAWESLVITVPPSYIAEIKQRMNALENRAYSPDDEAG